MPRWVGLGIEAQRAAAVAQNLRRVGVMLDRFQSRGADPDEAAACRQLHVTVDRTATTFEDLSLTSGGVEHPALIEVNTVWLAEEEDGAWPDVAIERLADDVIGPRDWAGRMKCETDCLPREI